MRTGAALHALVLLAGIALASTGVCGTAEFTPFHRYLHQNASIEAGLPQVSVNAMARDADGVLWVGTENGLALFDGSEFEDRSATLKSATGTTWVTALHHDSRGRVWIGTVHGVARVTDGRLGPVAIGGTDAPGKINAIAEDAASRVCVAARRLLCTRDDTLAVEAAWEGEATALAAAADGMWIAGHGELGRLDGRGMLHRVPLPSPLDGARIDALLVEGTRLWAGGTAGLWAIDTGQAAPVELAAPGNSAPQVRALTLDARGTLWVGATDGVFRLVDGTLRERLDAAALRSAGPVISLLADPDGGVWLGSQTNGLRYHWHAGVDQLGRRDGLGNLSTWTFLAGSDQLLTGTDDGVWAFRDGRYTALVPGAALPNPVAYSLLRDSAGGLFVGTRGGLARLPPEGGAPQTFPELATLQVSAMVEDPGGSVWVASSGGLFRVRAGRAERITERTGLDVMRLRSLLLDREGVLWVGSEEGLFRREGERFARVAEPGPARAFTMSLLQLADGTLLAGSYEQGLFVNGAHGWRRFSAADGLPSDTVFQMIEHDGTLIASHPNGVMRLPLASLAREDALFPEVLMQDIGKQPGRTRLRCCNGGGSNRGALYGDYAWFATLAGVLRVRVDGGVGRAPPRALLRGARQGERELAWPGPIELGPGARDIALRYGAVDFRDAPRLRYRYRLIGYDRDWVNAQSRRVAFYTNLPAGEFRFEVQAGHQHGAWGPETSTLVSVPPMLVERPPFRAAVALLALLSAALFMRWRETRSRKEQARLEATVAQRTHELRLANDRLATLNEALAAASVTDPLTGLHNRRFIHEQIGSVVANLRRNRARSGEDRVIGICVADVDHFKRVNDDYGHATGDRVLKRVATALRREMRDGDYLLRWGGEEFVVITNESLRDNLTPIVERLRAAVETSPGMPGEPTRVTISIGYAAYPLPGRELEDHDWLSAMNLADLALFGAKAAGRNRIASVELAESVRRQLPEHLTAAQLEELYASGNAHLRVGP